MHRHTTITTTCVSVSGTSTCWGKKPIQTPNTTTVYPFFVTFIKRHEFSIPSPVHAPQDRFVFPHFVHKRRQGQTNGEWQRTGVGYPDWHWRVAFTGGSNGRRGRRGVGLKGPFVGQFGIFVHATRCHIHDLKQRRKMSKNVSQKGEKIETTCTPDHLQCNSNPRIPLRVACWTKHNLVPPCRAPIPTHDGWYARPRRKIEWSNDACLLWWR